MLIRTILISSVIAAAGLPAGAQLKLAWKQTLPPNVRRVAVGDTTADGTQRAVMLLDGDKPGTRVIAVAHWDGKAWVTDFTAAAPDLTDRLAVGRFSALKEDVIVTNTALWYWGGDSYKVKGLLEPIALVGTVALRDGSERLLLNQPLTEKSPPVVRMYRVDPEQARWWVGGEDPPASSQTRFVQYKGIPAELTAMGVPAVLVGGGVVGLWDMKKTGGPSMYAIESVAQREVKNDEKNPVVRVKSREVRLAIIDPKVADWKILWRSENLDGNVVDVSPNDPHGSGAAGLAVLTDGILGSSHGHTLYFFKVE